ncbi:MAG: Gfo/Idh/MocA family oxidoreductase [Planctomycetes bacterium]|nr:Gfo/Idh/MocA family oxidoreductase [Planctomycetota bacterium]MCB9920499.1 Gfo/Idh/MocA family oxidoreductase [Planctomycetota bacterium]
MICTRRTFLGAASASLVLPATLRSRCLGSNEDLRIAVVGVRSRGGAHIAGFRNLKGVRVVALCDVDRDILAREVERFENGNPKRGWPAGEKVRAYTDIRKLLEAEDIDAISVATPNHWHALMAIWACEAGKDCYLEKPVSHNLREGRLIVESARKHGRIVGSGTQCRSSTGMQEAMQFIHDGGLGEIRLARGLCYKRRASIGKVQGDQKVPESIDYDLWTGPAPLVPLRRRSLHYDWHWIWATGNGDLGNQGIHQMDLCRWALGESQLAPRVLSLGARLGYDDDGETPNTQLILHEYAKAPLLFEVRGLPSGKPGTKNEQGKVQGSPMDQYHGASIGCVIHGSEAEMRIHSYNGGTVWSNDGEKLRDFNGGGDHFANFVQAVRSRKHSDLNSDIEEGHVSSALCHLGNVSLRCGRSLGFDEARERIAGRKDLVEAYGRLGQHLRANGLALEECQLEVGVPLEVEPASEAVTGSDRAPALLFRKGRGAFQHAE